MAQQATNPKIEELRGKLKADPKSRLFYQLAEELRKAKAFEEAEQVLRSGLIHSPTYLAAWVSLGRTLREEGKHKDAIDAFAKALQIDPGNAVAARQMADAYLALGDKVEAIKKFKLCRALMPADEELDALIEKLEEEINPVTLHKAEAPPQPAPVAPPPVEAPPPPPVAAAPPPPPVVEEEPEPIAERTNPVPFVPPSPQSFAEPEPIPAAPPMEESPFASEAAFAAESPFAEEPTPFADAAAAIQHEAEVAVATGDVEPMHQAHDESPFEEPAPTYTAAALEVEEPQAMHIEKAPLVAEVSAPWPEEEQAAEVFEPSQPAPAEGDVANTVTMADLYVQQGFFDRAQSIYESILDRDPNNDDVRAKLDALDARAAMAGRGAPAADDGKRGKTNRLEKWLTKVKGV